MVGVLVLPDDGPGMLETVLARCFAETREDDCIERFFQCVKAERKDDSTVRKGSDLRVPRHDQGSARLGRRSSQERSLGLQARWVQQRARVPVSARLSMTAGGEGDSSFGFADVKPLTDALLTEVRARLGDRLTAVALYGSVARGEAHRWSDIDLFVVHRGDPRHRLRGVPHRGAAPARSTAGARVDGAGCAHRPGRNLPLGG